MIDLSGTTYLWIKAFHLISAISWMAGLLYLPRLFVYHCGAIPGSKQSEEFKVMESKLLRGIVNPSMVLVFVFGGVLLVNLDDNTWSEGWLHAKLAFVLILVLYHILLSRWRRNFATDSNLHSAKFYRWVNEVPAVLMIGSVIFAVVRPF